MQEKQEISSTGDKQQRLYHYKVNLSLNPVQKLGDQAHHCKMDYWVSKNQNQSNPSAQSAHRFTSSVANENS